MRLAIDRVRIPGYHLAVHANLLTLLMLLSAAVAAVIAARRFKVPSMLAYLVIGIALGPERNLALLRETDEVSDFAEFGIVFLMFSIGLEFSIKRLRSMQKLVFGFGSAQMVLTALVTGLITWFGYQQGWKSSVAIGLAVAMSSTAIVARMLSESFELHSRSGRQTMGVLLFQDLAVVPCLILLPALAKPGEHLVYSLAIAAAQAVAVLTVLIWLGQKYLGRVIGLIASHRSDELLVLSTLWIVVGLSYLTALSGLSMALGAFVGGMLISETIYRHQVGIRHSALQGHPAGTVFCDRGHDAGPSLCAGQWPQIVAGRCLAHWRQGGGDAVDYLGDQDAFGGRVAHGSPTGAGR